MATHSNILAWRIQEEPGQARVLGVTELNMTERLSIFIYIIKLHI